MLFVLALRNIAKTWSKRLAFGVFFAATIALLFVGNTAFENSERGLAATYVASFTGQASISARSPDSFTIFGSDLPLIGQYLALPVIPDSESLRSDLAKLPGVRFVPQVTAAARLELDQYSDPVPVFGVEFRKYFDFFPGLKLEAGTLPDATKAAIALTRPLADRISAALKRPLVIGEKLTLSFALNMAFVTREVELAAIYSYPASDEILDRLVLTDPDTARALDGYLYGEPVILDEKSKGLMNSGLDDLFSGTNDTAAAGGSVVSPEQLLRQVHEQSAPKAGSIEGAWNFLLVRQDAKNMPELTTTLKTAMTGRPVAIRDWRETAGGNAQIAWFLRILFNLGLLFIAVVSCLILVNSLSLSILERTKEIGTMRALGAERGFVGQLIAWETILVVMGMGAVGIGAGALAVMGLSAAHLTLSNDYLASLFGSKKLILTLSWPSVFGHFALTVALGLAAIVLPVRRAVSIEPVKAIAREQ